MERLECLIIIPIIFFALIVISPAGADTNRSTLIAIYMVGSDLESEDNYATKDIGEILAGIPENTNQSDLVIGYGGSRKMGWNGLTFAPLANIRDDYKNGIIGDEKKYQSRDTEINMGSSEGFSVFLQKIKELGRYDRYILLFWDHGGAYYGICLDENYEFDALDLSELRSSLISSGIHWDLIGMDACLMGSYEVAKAVEGSADYLLVSEEAEPGHGWNYTLPLNTLSRNPQISIPEWGKVWIDEYIDNPYHEGHKKTLALIDLNKLPVIEKALSELGDKLNLTIREYLTYNGVGVSIADSQRYGYDPKRDQEMTIDLYDLGLHLGQTFKENSYDLNSLRNAITAAVVYSRNDGSRPGSHGISIFSPRMKKLNDLDYVEKKVQINEKWAEFINNYMFLVSQDTSRPKITELGNGKYQIIDDKGLAYVRIDTDWMPDIVNFSHSYGLKSEPVSDSPPGVYSPAPDDQTFFLKDSKSGEMVPFFHLYIGKDTQGQEHYFGYVRIIHDNTTREAVINTIRNASTQEITYALYPYELKENGEMIFSKGAATVERGDIIIPKLVERFLVPENPRWQYTPYTPLPVTGEVKVVRDRLPHGSFYSTLTATDYNMNFAMALLGELRFPNNSSIAGSSEPE
jgi:hypothetical protein